MSHAFDAKYMMRQIIAERWEPIGNTFLWASQSSNGEWVWNGHAWHSWKSLGMYEVGDRIRLSQIAPLCDGDVVITAVTCGSAIVVGGTGVWFDFQGLGSLIVEGEPVEFVMPGRKDSAKTILTGYSAIKPSEN